MTKVIKKNEEWEQHKEHTWDLLMLTLAVTVVWVGLGFHLESV